MQPRPITGRFGINAGTGITYPPAPSSGYEFGADDAQVQSLFGPSATAATLLSPTKIRSTFTAVQTEEVQFAENLEIPLVAGILVIPASFSGVVGYELELTLPDLGATTFSGNVNFRSNIVSLSGGGFDPIVYFTGGQYFIGDGAGAFIALGSGGTYRVAVDYDYPANEITLNYGANNLSYNSVSGTPAGDAILTFNTDLNPSSVGTALGLTLDVELIQDSADFTETHVGGAVALADALVVKV